MSYMFCVIYQVIPRLAFHLPESFHVLNVWTPVLTYEFHESLFSFRLVSFTFSNCTCLVKYLKYVFRYCKCDFSALSTRDYEVYRCLSMYKSTVVHLMPVSAALFYASSFFKTKCLILSDHDPSHDVTLLIEVALARPNKPADWNSITTTPNW